MKNLLILFSLLGLVNPILASKDGAMQCNCRGNGSYTFVFDAGIGNWSIFFQPMVDQIDGDFRICLIDRAGYSRKHREYQPADALSVAKQMKQVLSQKGITDSVILVAHSMGGLNVRMFQSLYPEMVKGMILIDAANPYMLEEMVVVQSKYQEQIRQMERIERMAKFGLLHFAKRQIPTFGMPDKYLKDYYKVVAKAFYYETYIRELTVFEQSIDQCKKLGKLGALPLLVIASRQGLNNPVNETPEAKPKVDSRWLKLQKDLASLSSNSTFLESDGDHFLQLSDQVLVISAFINFYKTNFAIKTTQ